MLQGGSKCQDMFLCSFEVPSRQKQPAQRDEHVASPTARPSSGEMRQTSGKRRRRCSRVKRGRLYEAVHLNGAQCKVLREIMPRNNEVRALLHNRSSGSLVCLRDDEREVLGAHIVGYHLLDAVESLFDPLHGFREVREGLKLAKSNMSVSRFQKMR